MAWQAQLMKDIGIDFASNKLIAVVEFFDDVNRAGTAVSWTFEIETGLGTAVQQRNELRRLVEEQGKVIRDMSARAVSMRSQVPNGTTIVVP